MSHIFISYSRKDLDFAQKIVDTLAANDLDTWIDWKSIPKGEDWEQEIYRGIEEADAFLFLLSPDSVTSEMCNKEIAHAVENGKRILPIVIRDANEKNFLVETAREEISKRNWIFCRDGQDDFNKAIEETRATIHTDYEWVKYHTELQVKALKWEHKTDSSRLLRGKELSEAEQEFSNIGILIDPQPTTLQRQFILASRRSEQAFRRKITMVAVIGLSLMAFLAIIALIQRNDAQEKSTLAKQREMAARALLLPDQDSELALLLASEAVQLLDPKLENYPTETEQSLYQNLIDRLFRGNLLFGQDTIAELLISPDSSRIIVRSFSNSLDNSLKLWDKYGNLISIISENSSSGDNAVFSPDGQHIVLSNLFSMTILDMNGSVIKEIPPLTADPSSIFPYQPYSYFTRFSRDGHYFAQAYWGGVIAVRTIEGELISVYKTGLDQFSEMEISPDASLVMVNGCIKTEYEYSLAICTHTNTQIWNLEGELIQSITTNGIIKFATFSPSGELYFGECPEMPENQLLVPNCSTIIKVRNEAGEINTIVSQPEDISYIYFNDAGTFFLTTPSTVIGNKKPALRDMQGNLIRTLENFVEDGNVPSVEILGNRILTESGSGIIQVWDENGNLIKEFQPYSGLLWRAKWFESNSKIATVGCDTWEVECVNSKVRIWDLNQGLIQSLVSTDSSYLAYQFNKTGSHILLLENDEQHGLLFPTLWDLEQQSIRRVPISGIGALGQFINSGDMIFIWDLYKPDNSESVNTTSDNSLDLNSIDKRSSMRIVNLRGENIYSLGQGMPFFLPPLFDKSFIGFTGATISQVVTENGNEKVLDVSANGQYLLKLTINSHVTVNNISSGNTVYDFGKIEDLLAITMIGNGEEILVTSCEKKNDQGICIKTETQLMASNGDITRFAETPGLTTNTYFSSTSNKILAIYCLPILDTPTPTESEGVDSSNSSASGGCHSFSASLFNLQGKITQNLNYIGTFESVQFDTNFDTVLFQSSSMTTDTSGQLYLWNSVDNVMFPLTGINGQIYSADVSENGERLMTLSSDKIVRIWDKKGNVIYKISRLGDNFTSAIISHNGTRIVTTNAQSVVELWEIYPDIFHMLEIACNRAGRNLNLAEWQQYVGNDRPYQVTCKKLPVPEDVRTYLDAEKVRRDQICIGIIGCLAFIILVAMLWRIRRMRRPRM